MKKITLLAAVALWSAAASVAQPIAQPRTDGLNLAQSLQQPETLLGSLPGTPRPAKAPRLTEAEEEIFWEAPEGTVRNLNGGFTGGAAANGTVQTALYANRGKQLVEGTDGNIYIYNLPTLLGPATYVKAEPGEGDTLLINRQPVYEAATGVKYYLAPVKWVADEEDETLGEFVEADGPIKLVYADGVLRSIDEDSDPLSGEGVAIGSYYGTDEAGYAFTGRVEWGLNFEVVNGEVLSLPEGVEPINVVLRYTSPQDGVSVLFTQTRIALDGDDVYINLYEDAWVKGTAAGDKVTFKPGQYLGLNTYYGYNLFFVTGHVNHIYDEDGNQTGLQAVVSDEVTLTLDREALTLTGDADDLLVVNAGGTETLYYLLLFWGPQFYVFHEVAAVPATPTNLLFYDYMERYGYDYNFVQFVAPTADIDGNYIDPAKLSYVLYIDGEPFTFEADEYTTLEEDTEEIPYGFNDGSQFFFGTYFKLFFYPAESFGVQTIYRGGGEEWRSNILTRDVETDELSVIDYYGTVGISSATRQPGQPEATRYFDLQGRRLSGAPQHGLYLKSETLSDGTVRTQKVSR